MQTLFYVLLVFMYGVVFFIAGYEKGYDKGHETARQQIEQTRGNMI